MRTPRSTAAAQVLRMIDGSPAWPPQAILALVTMSSMAASSPIVHGPKPSPRSLFRSSAMPVLPVGIHCPRGVIPQTRIAARGRSRGIGRRRRRIRPWSRPGRTSTLGAIMATYFDPKSWSPLWAVDFGKRLFEQSWLEQWISYTTAWVDPVADLGAGTVTALMPDVLLTVLSEGILSRFGGQEVTATLLGHDLTATLEVLKVRRRGAHFQTKTVLTDLHWDKHPI